jgi:hypothetical protein
MNQNSKGERVYRVSLTDRAIYQIVSALRSQAKAGGTRKTKAAAELNRLAERLFERSRGNPNLIHNGTLKEATE